MLASVRATATAQRELLLFLWRDPRFRPPLIVIWVASFGGALHAPVTTFYQLKLGASDEDIGMIGLFWNVGSLFMPPFYGWLLDTRGGYLPMMISIVLCSVGCLVRGLAINVSQLYAASLILGLGGINLWTTVCSYIATNTPAERRSLVVSGYLFQITTVRIVGTSLYPAWSAVLNRLWPGEEHDLFRDRLSMGVCVSAAVFFPVFFRRLTEPAAHRRSSASSGSSSCCSSARQSAPPAPSPRPGCSPPHPTTSRAPAAAAPPPRPGPSRPPRRPRGPRARLGSLWLCAARC